MSKMSVGTTELWYSTKKRQHFLDNESFFRPTLISSTSSSKIYSRKGATQLLERFRYFGRESALDFLPAFTGNQRLLVNTIRWNSFSPKTRKISLIKTLVHRALMICSKTKLGSELDKIKQLLFENRELFENKISRESFL